jgi:hypothetical protein
MAVSRKEIPPLAVRTKRITVPVILGLLFLACGGLLLLQATGVTQDRDYVFWASLFGAAGALFLVYLVDRVFWTVYAGFPLLGISAGILAGQCSTEYGWAAFFFVSSAAFWLLYAVGRPASWWAIMPGGTLVSLGVVLIVGTYVSNMVNAGIFCLCLSFTFLAILFLTRENKWAYIPAGSLAVAGVLFMALGTSTKAVLYSCAVILIAVGIAMIIRSLFLKKE